MKIKGKYLKKLLEYVDCEILLEYGKIQRIKFASRQVFNSQIPFDNSQFSLERLSSEPGIIPVDSNYELKYINKNNEEKKIYLNLNRFQVFKYKWITKQYIIQSKELKTDILKYIIGGILGFLGTIMVQHYTSVDEQINNKEPATEIIGKTETLKTNNENLISFLENPIDLQGFKDKKKQSLSTVMNGAEYYWNPKINDSIHYLYSFLPNDPLQSKIEQLEIVVFKFGKNKHSWKDKTEILIELNVKAQDSILGNANLIGLTKTELESLFGSEYITLDNRIVYSNKNKILILELDNSRVQSFNYVKLNTEKIDSDLIRKITE